MNAKIYDSPPTNPDVRLPISVIACGWEQCTTYFSCGPCLENHYVLHFVVKGCGKYHSDGKTYLLKTGDGCISRPSGLSYLQSDQKEPWEHYWIEFGGEYVQPVLETVLYSGTSPVFHCGNQNKIIKMLDDMIVCYEKGGNPHELVGYFYLLVSALSKKTRQENQYLIRALKYIKQNFRQIDSVTQVAEHVGLSRSYLYRLFVENLKRSPQQVLLDWRMSIAREMLKSGLLPISEIASACGFHDTAHFSNIFKKKTGQPPLQYRKSYAKQYESF